MSRRLYGPSTVNLQVDARQLAGVLAMAHSRLDSAGVDPAPKRLPWEQWLAQQQHRPPAPAERTSDG